MKIALCGAQGVGKTTLAKALAEKLDIPFVKSNVGDFLLSIGVVVGAPMELLPRMQAQLETLYYLRRLYNTGLNFITDRSPLDVIAYSQQLMYGSEDPDVEAVYQQIKSLGREMAWSLNYVIHVSPGVKVSQEDGERPQRASLLPSNVRLINNLMLAESYKLRRDKPAKAALHFMVIMGEHLVDLEARVKGVTDLLEHVGNTIGPKGSDTVH